MNRQAGPVDRHVGRRICELRQGRRMSQMDLAGRLGVTFQQIQKYEAGANRVSASRLFDIAHALKAPVADFFPDGPFPPAVAEPASEAAST